MRGEHIGSPLQLSPRGIDRPRRSVKTDNDDRGRHAGRPFDGRPHAHCPIAAHQPYLCHMP